MNISQISTYFIDAHLAGPNTTILTRALRDDRRASVRAGLITSLSAGDAYFRSQFPHAFTSEEEATKIPENLKLSLLQTPFIDQDYIANLEKQVELYALLHVIENSLRRFIAHIMQEEKGTSWWESSASAEQKRKHSDRMEKERKRAWLPTRSDFGPLYSLDWSDLITIIRKNEEIFLPYIGEINFLHRFNDLGLLRHVVAHNGFVADEGEYARVRVALGDLQRQLATRV